MTKAEKTKAEVELKNEETSAPIEETVVEEPKAEETIEEIVEEIKEEEKEEEKELVVKAKISDFTPSSYVILTNTTQNTLCLADRGISITLYPREIKRDVRRSDLLELLQNRVIRNWFDKGMITSNLDASDVSAHDAVAPKHLSAEVERHDDGMNISAKVTKFKSAGSIDLNLI